MMHDAHTTNADNPERTTHTHGLVCPTYAEDLNPRAEQGTSKHATSTHNQHEPAALNSRPFLSSFSFVFPVPPL